MSELEGIAHGTGSPRNDICRESHPDLASTVREGRAGTRKCGLWKSVGIYIQEFFAWSF